VVVAAVVAIEDFVHVLVEVVEMDFKLVVVVE
jgi:hypothetical protein